jgi:hypothetical protein
MKRLGKVLLAYPVSNGIDECAMFEERAKESGFLFDVRDLGRLDRRQHQ